MPPDLSSYRLTFEDSLRIFQSVILPAEFCNLPGQSPSSSASQPLAILAVGQTGAGKTRLSPTILSMLRQFRDTNHAHLIAVTYKTYHPEYTRLMHSTPQLASSATGPDARNWLAMASEEVTRRRIDVLVESSCRHPDDFEGLVRVYSKAGYRVEVVLLAVPSLLSKLGILVRYYEKLPEGQSRNLPVRLTPDKVHDASFKGILDAARFLDESNLADQVVIVRRGNLVAYGVGNDKSEIAAALERERRRLLTMEEMKSALDDIQRLETQEEAREKLNVIREMLRSSIEGDREQGGEWPDLRPLAFGKVGEEAGGTYNVLRLGQI